MQITRKQWEHWVSLVEQFPPGTATLYQEEYGIVLGVHSFGGHPTSVLLDVLTPRGIRAIHVGNLTRLYND